MPTTDGSMTRATIRLSAALGRAVTALAGAAAPGAVAAFGAPGRLAAAGAPATTCGASIWSSGSAISVSGWTVWS